MEEVEEEISPHRVNEPRFAAEPPRSRSASCSSPAAPRPLPARLSLCGCCGTERRPWAENPRMCSPDGGSPVRTEPPVVPQSQRVCVGSAAAGFSVLSPDE